MAVEFIGSRGVYIIKTKGGRCTHAPTPYPSKPTFAGLLSYHLYE